MTGRTRVPDFGRCCNKGTVRLPLLQAPPEPLRALLEENTPKAKAFRRHIRGYNSAFQMASSGLCVDDRFGGGEPSC